MVSAKRSLVFVEEYLESELLSEVKREYIGGEIFERAETTNLHNSISDNVLCSMWEMLRGKPCLPFNSDTKVRVVFHDHTRFYYPDGMVVCQSNPGEDYWQDHPVVIIEVLSESTWRIDTGEKYEAYCSIPSLKVLIYTEQDEPVLIVYRRADDGAFLREDYVGLATVIPLPEIGIELPLAEVYEGIEFGPMDL